MHFADPLEQERVVGPLYATAAKAATPVFGPDKFTKKSVIDRLSYEVKTRLKSSEDAVVDTLAPFDTRAGVAASSSSELDPLGDGYTRHNSESKERKPMPIATNGTVESTIHKRLSSSRGLKDQAQYSALGRLPPSTSDRERRDHLMLLRSIDGYLFDPIVNQTAVMDVESLLGVWKWIEGMP